MSQISKSILSALLSHTAYTAPPVFGVPSGDRGYNASARVASAGTTFAELHAAGVGLQSETHGRSYGHKDWKGLSPAEKAARLRVYYLEHGAVLQPDTRATAEYRAPDGMYPVGGTPLDARVNPTTCPSGLRPRIIPSGGKIKDANGNVTGTRPTATAEQVAAWHTALVAAVNATPDGGMVTIPELVTTGGTTLETPIPAVEVRTVARVSGSAGFRAFVSARDSVLGSITALVSALRAADDQTRTAPLADRIIDWGATIPVDALNEIGPQDFDTSTVREGSLVTLIPHAKGLQAVRFMAEKVSKLDTVPSVLRVNRIVATTSMCFLTADGFKREVPVVLTELRRFVPPPAVTVGAWSPTVGSTAMFAGAEVLVDKIDGSLATIMTEDGDEMEVELKDLTAPV